MCKIYKNKEGKMRFTGYFSEFYRDEICKLL